MMTPAVLFAWLVALPLLHDGHGAPIPRRELVAMTIANAAAATDRPQFWASILDVWAAYESGYGDATIAGGCPGVAMGTPCKREQGAKYCGPWMTSCGRVPRGSTLLDEAKVAIAMFLESFAACPDFPFSFYAAGDCRAHRVVDFRVRFIRAEMAAPISTLEENPK